MELSYKSAPMHTLADRGLPEGQKEMIVSVYGNVDSYNERILYGFFDGSIEAHAKGKSIPGLYYHDKRMPIAKTLELRNIAPYDPVLPEKSKANGGLYVLAEYNLDTQIGRETYSNVSKGIITEYSVGIVPQVTRMGTDGVNELVSGDLWEWSAVLWGANDLTSTLALPMGTHIDTAEAACVGLVRHLQAYVNMRTKEGRKLSAATVERLTAHLSSMDTAITTMAESASDIRRMIEDAQPDNSSKAMLMMAAARERASALKTN